MGEALRGHEWHDVVVPGRQIGQAEVPALAASSSMGHPEEI